jgi:hypothetical protein
MSRRRKIVIVSGIILVLGAGAALAAAKGALGSAFFDDGMGTDEGIVIGPGVTKDSLTDPWKIDFTHTGYIEALNDLDLFAQGGASDLLLTRGGSGVWAAAPDNPAMLLRK